MKLTSKINNIKFSKIELSALLGMIFSIILCAFIPFQQECETLYPSVLRLHILADSNSDIQQELKLEVRDNILNASPEILENSTTYTDAILAVEKNLDKIKNIAQNTLIERGFDLPVDVSLVEDSLVDTRVYDGFTMPSGRYTALTVKIGSGNGKNWWCLMYPPLCLNSAIDDMDIINSDEVKKIAGLDDTPNYKMKFASVEIFQSILGIIKRPNLALVE